MQLRWEKRGMIYGIALSVLLCFVPWIMQLFGYPDWKDPVNMLNIAGPLILTFLLYWNRWWIIDTFVEQY